MDKMNWKIMWKMLLKSRAGISLPKHIPKPDIIFAQIISVLLKSAFPHLMFQEELISLEREKSMAGNKKMIMLPITIIRNRIITIPHGRLKVACRIWNFYL